MPKPTAHPFDVARRALAEAALSLLADTPLAELGYGHIAAKAKVDEALARQLFASIIEIIDTALMNIDADIANRIAQVLAEADAMAEPLRDRIMEGLMQRFEAYTPHKAALRNLESASRRNPVLATMLLKRLDAGMRVLLAVAEVEVGDTPKQDTRLGTATDAFARFGMSAGLGVICLSVWRAWMRDETADLAETSRVLDTRLRQAEQWAMCFAVDKSAWQQAQAKTGKNSAANGAAAKPKPTNGDDA